MSFLLITNEHHWTERINNTSLTVSQIRTLSVNIDCTLSHGALGENAKAPSLGALTSRLYPIVSPLRYTVIPFFFNSLKNSSVGTAISGAKLPRAVIRPS